MDPLDLGYVAGLFFVRGVLYFVDLTPFVSYDTCLAHPEGRHFDLPYRFVGSIHGLGYDSFHRPVSYA